MGNEELKQTPESGGSPLNDGLYNEDGKNNLFDLTKIKISDYPENYIPNGAQIIVAYDEGSKYGDCSIKAFFDPKTGEYHIQEVVYNV